MKHFYMSESQRHIVVNALRVAATRYQEHVDALQAHTTALSVEAEARLAKQFGQQKTDALYWAVRLEACEFIIVGPEGGN